MMVHLARQNLVGNRHVFRAFSLDPIDVRTLKSARNGRHDRPRDVVLEVKHVSHILVVALGPDVVAARRLDELSGDTDTVANLTHVALKLRPPYVLF
jgi:hypothetical protein